MTRHELQEQCGGRGIEPVGIVDDHDETAGTRLARELGAGAAREQPTAERAGRVALPDPGVSGDHRTPAATDRLLQTIEHVLPADRCTFGGRDPVRPARSHRA
jgi:hypothetical protein